MFDTDKIVLFVQFSNVVSFLTIEILIAILKGLSSAEGLQTFVSPSTFPVYLSLDEIHVILQISLVVRE